MCTTCVPGANESQKRTLDHLDLELQMLVSYYVSAGTRTQGLCKSSQCFWPFSYLSKRLPGREGVGRGTVGLTAGKSWF